MPDILLITTSERVKELFLSLEKDGGMRVRTAASVPLAKLGVSLSPPDCTFVHGRVSGDPVHLLIQHMKTILPQDANVAFLAEEAEDIEQAANHGVTVIDLNMDDTTLRTVLGEVLEDLPNSLTGKVIEIRPTPELVALDPEGAWEEESEAEELLAGGSENAAMRAALRLQSYGQSHGKAAPDVAGWPAPQSAETRSLYQEVCDRVAITPPEGTGRHVTVRELLQQAEWSEQIGKESAVDPMRAASGALAATVAVLSLLVYLGVSSPSASQRNHLPGPAPALPVPTVTAKVVPTARQAPPKSTPKKGLPSLPRMLGQCKLDREFGKSHPGWERLVGANYEYKLFREDGVYRIMKVTPRKKEPIPEQFIKKVLLQFSGTDRYQANAEQKKGRLVVARGRSATGVAVSLYKDPADHCTRSFALYFE